MDECLLPSHPVARTDVIGHKTKSSGSCDKSCNKKNCLHVVVDRFSFLFFVL